MALTQARRKDIGLITNLMANSVEKKKRPEGNSLAIHLTLIKQKTKKKVAKFCSITAQYYIFEFLYLTIILCHTSYYFVNFEFGAQNKSDRTVIAEIKK